MNRFLSLRPARVLATATISNRAKAFMAAPYLRAAVLGGLLAAGTIGSALAQTAPSVKAKQADAQSLWLTVENPTQQRMQLRVVSLTTDQCLMNEVNRQISYGSHLNFNGVPVGQYAVTLRVGHERYRYTVQVQNLPKTTISVRELAQPAAPVAVASVAR